MKPVIGKIPYLNSFPFYAGWEKLPIETIELFPSQLGNLAREGKIYGGLLSLYDFFTVEDEFAALDLGIAARGPVKSILLFTDCPLWDLSGKQVAVTEQTATSFRLMRLILEIKEKQTGLRYTTDITQKPAGMLLIGNQALAEKRKKLRTYRYLYDLSEFWYHWTGLPFVFAVWAFRKTLPPAILEKIRIQLEGSLEKSLANLEKTAALGSEELGTLEERTNYLRGIIYRLGPEEKKGLEQFRSALVRAKMLEEASAVA
ncbi:MAG TPA: menaquinone biosynthesis protein [candidate division Zixibacteria bacterium]|nr:menaquinone biosynthesis protein [candidate division Zixibacteria bacterium]